jgi:hypothetical protein
VNRHAFDRLPARLEPMRSPILIAAVLVGCGPSDRQVCMEAVLERPDVDPSGVDTVWVVDSMNMPTTATEANQFGVNLDCDEYGRPDNAVGQILSTFASYNVSSDLDTDVNAMIDAGRLIELLTLRATSTADAEQVGLTLQHGIDLDGDPTDNLGGAETFAVDTERGGGTATGRIVAAHLSVRGGPYPVGIPLPSLDAVVIVPLAGVSVELDIGDGRLSGLLGGAIPSAVLDQVLLPSMHDALVRQLDSECSGSTTGAPPCGCTALGQSLIDLYDWLPDRPGNEPDGDCMIDLDELGTNPLIRLLLEPDVDLFDADGVLNPGVDGNKDSLSIGFAFTAVPATIQP